MAQPADPHAGYREPLRGPTLDGVRIVEFEPGRHITGVVLPRPRRVFGPMACSYVVGAGSTASYRLVVRLNVADGGAGASGVGWAVLGTSGHDAQATSHDQAACREEDRRRCRPLTSRFSPAPFGSQAPSVGTAASMVGYIARRSSVRPPSPRPNDVLAARGATAAARKRVHYASTCRRLQTGGLIVGAVHLGAADRQSVAERRVQLGDRVAAQVAWISAGGTSI